MLVPTDGGEEYYSGSSLGSWDVLMRYNLRNGMTIRGYMQKPWEDGSGNRIPERIRRFVGSGTENQRDGW